jgi:Flp pilus assembly protein TadG
MIRRSLEVARDDTGAVLVEFTILSPVLLLMLLGVLQFGLLYYYRISVTTAAVVGARMLSVYRSDPTALPYSDTVAAIQNASSNLNASKLTITLATYNGAAWIACNADTSCSNLMGNARGSPTVAPQPARVTVSYPCPILIPTSWVNLSSGICPMTSTVTVRVQ